MEDKEEQLVVAGNQAEKLLGTGNLHRHNQRNG